MASASPDQGNQNPPLFQRLLEAWQPKFPVFEQRRLAGAPPSEPEISSDSEILPIPEVTTVQSDDESSIELVPEIEAATWLTTHVRSTEDILLSRIPAWGVEGVTTCIFPKIVALRWPSIVYEPIGKAETSCLRVKNSRKGGKGCVARRAVPRGELVARERALLVMPRTCISPRQFVNAATNTMTPNERAAFFALHNCSSADSNDTISIISTNSFLIPGVPGHDVLYSAVFETFSRLNHRWDRGTFSGEIRALRPISAGEEVTISYFQGIMEPVCISKLRDRSDEERPIISKSVTHIGKYYREIVEAWIMNEENDHARLPNDLHALEEALDQEKIFDPTYWIYLARAMVIVRCTLREAKAARKWADRAAQHTRAVTGSDGGWDAIAKEPEKCEWWGLWDKSRLQGNEDVCRSAEGEIGVSERLASIEGASGNLWFNEAIPRARHIHTWVRIKGSLANRGRGGLGHLDAIRWLRSLEFRVTRLDVLRPAGWCRQGGLVKGCGCGELQLNRADGDG
ncbi:hypothetical protein BGY98DRAFT_937079 [Russula aff. rugulosa BPL654]|nr:hypothetical protein BGY98DRAFT_937079 [Russula aff. rugulosa BPL654]